MKTIEIDGEKITLTELEWNGEFVVCPKCGHPLRMVEPIYRETSPQTYEHPADYEIVAWQYVCNECGEEFYSEEEI